MFKVITNKSICIVQLPTINNSYHAVCIVNITTSTGSYSSIGEAQGTDDTAVKSLLQQAEEDGFERALQQAEKYSIQSSQPMPPQNIFHQISTSPDYGMNAGGGDKPISILQVETLQNMYGPSLLGKITKEKFNTSITNLKGRQAQILFDEHKSWLKQQHRVVENNEKLEQA